MLLTPLEFAVLGLASWTLAYMLVRSDGLFHMFAKLRKRTTLGGLLECVFCCGVWMALLLYAVWQLIQWPVYVLAIAGLAAVVDQWAG